MLIGNGFTIDFVKPNGLNSSKPLNCFDNEYITYDDFIDYLPEVKAKLITNQREDHFQAIKEFRENNRSSIKAESQLKIFLAMMYAKLQMQMNQIDIIDWKWFKWFKKNYFDLTFAVSFNYDLLFERILKEVGLKSYRTGTSEQRSRIPIFKPHGSFDFDVGGLLNVRGSRWGYTVKNNDVRYLDIAPTEKWTEARFDPYLVPPLGINDHMNFQWYQEGLSIIKKKAKEISHFVIIGCSYCEVDRLEIDTILKSLKKGTKVILCNPHPIDELVERIQELGLVLEQQTAEYLPWDGVVSPV